MPKGKKGSAGPNGHVSVKISAAAYAAAEAQCAEASEEASKKIGMTIKVKPAQVIERMLLWK